MSTPSFQDLRVWRQAIDLTLQVYEATSAFPKHETYGLAQQMRRAAVSTASNIAEGKGRWSRKEFRQFLFNARGSLLELETQIVIAGKLEYLEYKQSSSVRALASQVGRSLTGLLNSLATPVN
jgi:four helix bundle protein